MTPRAVGGEPQRAERPPWGDRERRSRVLNGHWWLLGEDVRVDDGHLAGCRTRPRDDIPEHPRPRVDAQRRHTVAVAKVPRGPRPTAALLIAFNQYDPCLDGRARRDDGGAVIDEPQGTDAAST